MTDAPTPDDFRAAGFTAAAADHPRSDLALRMICAFNNIGPDQAPPAWAYHPDDHSRKAWERVATVAAAANTDLLEVLEPLRDVKEPALSDYVKVSWSLIADIQAALRGAR